MPDEDVERFLWELERHLADLPGDRRIEALKQVERDLDVVAQRHALEDGRDATTWHDYVQATAELGPPDHLAARILGHAPTFGARSRVVLGLAAAAGLVLVAVLVIALLQPNDFTQVGRWSGAHEDHTGTWNATFEVAPDARNVRLVLDIFPATTAGSARVLVLDGAANAVYEQGSATGRLQTTRFLEGEPGTWRVIVDFDGYTGPWSVTAYEAR